MVRFILLALILFGQLAMVPPLAARDALAAVASNFLTPAERLAAAYRKASGHVVRLSAGSTGKLYAQIRHGGPFDMFLAADQERPRLLEEQGLAVAGSRFTFAIGRLALIRADGGEAGPEYLKALTFRRFAIANPKLAPYGLAAEQALSALGVIGEVRGRLVYGENISQTLAMVATGNAEAGLVALSMARGPHWEIPAALHEPMRQDAVLLVRAAENEAARGFLTFLRSPEGQAAIRAFGYDTDGGARD